MATGVLENKMRAYISLSIRYEDKNAVYQPKLQDICTLPPHLLADRIQRDNGEITCSLLDVHVVPNE